MSVIEQKEIDSSLVPPVLDLLRSYKLDSWIYRGAEWYVQDPKGPHVDREAKTVHFAPTVVDSYDELTTDVAKIVGVSDDPDAVIGGQAAARAQFGDRVSAAGSQPYYLDVTHPDANKGQVVKFLSHRFDIPDRTDRHHRGHAQRHAHVRRLGIEHRHGQRRRARSSRQPLGSRRPTRTRGSPTPSTASSSVMSDRRRGE